MRCEPRAWKHAGWARRLLAPVAAFLLHHALVGLAFALATGYPYWLFFTFPDTQPRSPPPPTYINATQEKLL